MTFRIFESYGEKYSMDDIKELPAFKLLLAMGYYETSTPAMKKHMSVRLYNNELELDNPNDNIVVYSSGYIRRNTPTRYKPSNQSVRIKFDGDETLKRWNDQFLYVYDWTLKQYRKKGIVSKYGDIKKSEFVDSDSVIDFMVKKNAKDQTLIFSLYDSLGDDEKNKFIKKIKTTRKDFEDRIRKYRTAMNILDKWLK